MANPDRLVLVAVAAGEVVGHLLGAFAAPSAMWVAARAELVSLHVAPRWRGQGIGSQLLQSFASWARDRGVCRLQVTAYSANESAIRFYQRHGFAPLETTLAVEL